MSDSEDNKKGKRGAKGEAKRGRAAAAPKGKKAAAGKGRKRAEKDKDAPKRPLSAFLLFSNDRRAQVKEDNPDAAFGKIGSILGEMWKSASEDVKAKFQKQAEAAKAEYEKAKEAYAAEKSSGKKASKAPSDDDQEEDDDEEGDEDDD